MKCIALDQGTIETLVAAALIALHCEPISISFTFYRLTTIDNSTLGEGHLDPAVQRWGAIDFSDPRSNWSPTYVSHCRQLLGDAMVRRMAIFALPEAFLLTVIVPVYNEANTVAEIAGRLQATGLPMQIILVDDGSTDATAERLAELEGVTGIEVIRHTVNRGKGAAIRSAIPAARGDVIVIQDADREYDPDDFRWLLQPILAGEADVVYGTRYGQPDRQVSPWWHQAANGLVTLLASMAIGLRLRDIETCYKMARRESFARIASDLRENRFGIEIEITARWARAGMRFAERPIRYHHRWYGEGKKITWRDGIAALGCIFRYGVLRR